MSRPIPKSWEEIHKLAFRAAGLQNPDNGEREEIAQEVTVRLFLSSLKAECTSPVPQAAWIRAVVRNVQREYKRRQRRRALSLPDLDVLEGKENRAVAPDKAAEARDLCRRVRVESRRLPMPYQVIAEMRLRGSPYREIASHLHRWRGVGTDDVRRLSRETLRMLRLSLDGVDLRRRFPRRFRSKSPWNTTPPPWGIK